MTQVKKQILLNFFFWTCFGFYNAFNSYYSSFSVIIQNGTFKPYRGEIWLILIKELSGAYLWFLISFVVYKVFVVLFNRSFIRLVKIGLMVFLGFIFAPLHFIGDSVISSLLTNEHIAAFEPSKIELINPIVSGSIRSFLSYAIMLILLMAWDYYKRYERESLNNAHLTSQLLTSQLQQLKMQLHPHFVFNSMNTIAMMVRANRNKEAVNAISGLSDLLRKSLLFENRHLISLKEELQLVQQYLDIEAIRFKDKLEVVFEIQASTLNISVPTLILQPVIENAFKHGFEKSNAKAKLIISSEAENGYLLLKVFNSGSQLSDEIKPYIGVGLSNGIKRLENIYGGSATFFICNEPNGVLATFKMPKESRL